MIFMLVNVTNIVDTAFKNYYGQTNIEKKKKLRRELMYVSKTF